MDSIRSGLEFENRNEDSRVQYSLNVVSWIKRQNKLQERIDQIQAAWISKDKSQVSSAIIDSIQAHFELSVELGIEKSVAAAICNHLTSAHD
jgi:hypothetical protein